MVRLDHENASGRREPFQPDGLLTDSPAPSAVRRGVTVSLVVHAVLAALVFTLPARAVRILEPEIPIGVVFLPEPIPEPEIPEFPEEPRPTLPESLPAPESPPEPERAIPDPVVEEPPPPPGPAPRPETAPVPEPEPPKRVVQTQVFGVVEGEPAVPEAPRRAGRVGLFGDGTPAGSPSERSSLPAPKARLGAFEVASASVPSADGRRRTAAVHRGGFDAAPEKPAAPAPEKVRPTTPDTPVEILSKATPVYTAEARRLRVEGEVELDVVFEASGRLRIVGVRRSLGHGLDEAAVAAAKQIVFKPARRDGRPVDHAATLRVLFQLA